MSDYIKGIWIEEKAGKYGTYQHASIKVEDFIAAIRQLPVSEKGYVSFAIGRKKDKPTEYSCKVYKERPPQNPAPQPDPRTGTTDDMPF